MNRLIAYSLLSITLLTSGCASTLRSEVTSFNQWPTDLAETTYYFNTPAADQQSLEYQQYQDLVNQQLFSIGLDRVDDIKKATLEVSMRYGADVSDVRQVTPVPDPFSYGPGFYPRCGRWGGFYGPGFGPYWDDYGYEDETVQVYRRTLKIDIARIQDKRKLYEVTVKNSSTDDNTARIMPYLIKAAFVGFPGENGVPRTIELKTNPG